MLHLLANPGPAPYIEVPWGLIIFGTCVGFVVFAVLFVLNLRNRLFNAWEMVATFFVCVVVGFVAGFLAAMIMGFSQAASVDAAWEGHVQHWLSADYGVTVTTDDVADLARGKAVVVTVDGHSEPLTLTASKTGKLIPSTGQVLLPTRSR